MMLVLLCECQNIYTYGFAGFGKSGCCTNQRLSDLVSVEWTHRLYFSKQDL